MSSRNQISQRFRRLEALLGAPLDGTLTDEHLQRLVVAAVAETDDVDFKVGLYAKGDEGAAELGKDVSAFANHIGGVLTPSCWSLPMWIPHSS